MPAVIVRYQSQYKKHFISLDKAWFEEYLFVEVPVYETDYVRTDIQMAFYL